MAPFDRESDVRVLIACEDSAAAEQAGAALEAIGRQWGQGGRLIYDSWNFEVLAITALRTIAIREAAAADLVIIALHEALELPPEVSAWIESWRDLRKARPEPLMVILVSDLRDSHGLLELCSQIRRLTALEPANFLLKTDCKNLESGKISEACESTRKFLTACRKSFCANTAPGA